ncbi:MAG TPA: hypothetical protein PKD20_04960 [Candidatus Saccharibacteria bacterium]|jgi:hypothetical protein|nr:hypothetical protein [Candidatus Saccharibacteria bacterium]HMT56193.1 hypothetical protein [Candidatus Saccharibacteria bacterium]
MNNKQEDPRLSPEVVFEIDGVFMHRPRVLDLYKRTTKRGLTSRLGSSDFLRGLQKEGVEIGPIISRRDPRRMNATRANLGVAGLGSFFPQSRILLSGSYGSEYAIKNSDSCNVPSIIDRAYTRVVGVVDDSPHGIGKYLLDDLLSLDITNEPIVIGVVPSGRREESMNYSTIVRIYGEGMSQRLPKMVHMVKDLLSIQLKFPCKRGKTMT